MQLVHYSDRPLTIVGSVPQTAARESIGKPCGLWVSVEEEDGWRDWCLGERWGLHRLTHVHDVQLAPDANLLRLTDEADIDAFTRDFRERSNWFFGGINWERVAENWQGITIIPYVWSRRLHKNSGWYYSWDCASGCIWDSSAIASVTLRDVVSVPTLADSKD